MYLLARERTETLKIDPRLNHKNAAATLFDAVSTVNPERATGV